MDLTGKTTVNGTDIWTTYGAFLGESTGDGHANMDNLLRVPKAKDITSVDFRERTGVELPPEPDLKLASIERTLQFWLVGSSEADRLSKYRAFTELLTSGVLEIAVAGYRTYTMVYQDMPAVPEWYPPYGGRAYVFFTVKFLEPNPTV